MKSIEIKNFKAFNKNSILLGDVQGSGHKNILCYGENGSGKTSIYEAIKFFFFKERIIKEKVPNIKVGEERKAEIRQLESNYRNKSTIEEDIFIEVDGMSIESFNFDEQEVYMVSGKDLQVSNEIDILELLNNCYLTRNTIIGEEGCVELIIHEVNRLLSEYFHSDIEICLSQDQGNKIVIEDRDLCKTHCSKFAHFIIFLYLYSMKQRPSSPSFADLIVGHRKVKQTFFLQIDQIIDWNAIRGLIEIAYTKGNCSTGRPSYDSLVLFKTELLRTWYGLSDGEVEDQVNDRLSFSRFVGLGLDNCAPDSTTVCRFRNILVEADLYDNVLQEINRQLELAGVLVKRGAIVDASITDSPRRPRGRKEYEVVEDRNEESGRDVAENAMVKEIVKPNVDGEARWVKKMGKLHFGYKRHSVTDENGLVIAEETTPANESDIKHLEKPLEKAKLPQGTPVYADKGYDSTANKDVLKRMKLKSRIMHKGVRGHKLTEREQRVNVAISKTRYKVERTFGSIHRWFHGGIARYVGLAKTHAQHIMEAIAYNLYRTPGIIVSNSLK